MAKYKQPQKTAGSRADGLAASDMTLPIPPPPNRAGFQEKSINVITKSGILLFDAVELAREAAASRSRHYDFQLDLRMQKKLRSIRSANCTEAQDVLTIARGMLCLRTGANEYPQAVREQVFAALRGLSDQYPLSPSSYAARVLYSRLRREDAPQMVDDTERARLFTAAYTRIEDFNEEVQLPFKIPLPGLPREVDSARLGDYDVGVDPLIGFVPTYARYAADWAVDSAVLWRKTKNKAAADRALRVAERKLESLDRSLKSQGDAAVMRDLVKILCHAERMANRGGRGGKSLLTRIDKLSNNLELLGPGGMEPSHLHSVHAHLNVLRFRVTRNEKWLTRSVESVQKSIIYRPRLAATFGCEATFLCGFDASIEHAQYLAKVLALPITPSGTGSPAKLPAGTTGQPNKGVESSDPDHALFSSGSAATYRIEITLFTRERRVLWNGEELKYLSPKAAIVLTKLMKEPHRVWNFTELLPNPGGYTRDQHNGYVRDTVKTLPPQIIDLIEPSGGGHHAGRRFRDLPYLKLILK